MEIFIFLLATILVQGVKISGLARYVSSMTLYEVQESLLVFLFDPEPICSSNLSAEVIFFL